MAEETEALEYLRAAGFLHTVRDAHEHTTLAVFNALSRAEGFRERTFGTAAFEGLESRLDEALLPRDDLNGSPGWRCGPYRILLKRFDIGGVDAIRWDKLSPTKQAVAKQSFAGDPQLALDLGMTPPAVGREDVTLVLAHAASEDPLELELYLGRPRFNADAGKPWWWRSALTRDTLGPDPRAAVTEPTLPLWSDDTAGVPLRPRENRDLHETA